MLPSIEPQSALVLFLVVGVPVLFAWLALLVQCANASFKADGDKVAWVLILILLGPIGAALYLMAGRSRQIKSADQGKWML